MTQLADHGMHHSHGIPAPAHNSVKPDAALSSDSITQCLLTHVGEQNFQHWFEGRSKVEAIGDQLLIHVANPFISSWMLKRFRHSLASAAVALLGPSGSFHLHVDASLKLERTTKNHQTAVSGGTADFVGTGMTATDSGTRVPVRSAGAAVPAARPAGRRRFRSFHSFVSGPCNELALMAARQIIASPGDRLNPLYIHGPTGVGKTHLLEAVYKELRRQRPNLNVLFLTSEAFTNYFTNALASRSVPSFRQRFRSVDVLLIDNVEFLGNKKATQEEFLHTIDQLTDHGGQLVLTSDRHPRLLTRHREELTTRFVSGLVCRIETPAESTRRKLIESLALPHRKLLSSGVLDYLVRQGGRNARELQGAVNCLVSQGVLRGERITAREAREMLGELRDECRHLVRISDVERIVCEAFGVSAQDMRSKTRRKAISCPRSVAMYVARKLTKSAWREIGQYFGGRDHSTVVAAAHRVERWIDEDATVELPNSCRGTSWSEVVREIEERLLALAS